MIKIEFKFPDWKGKLERAEEELNLFLAAQIQFNRGMLFDQEGAYNGHPKWAPLRWRRGQILSKSGTLRKSIAPYNPKGKAGTDGIVKFSGEKITVGTKLAYAKRMNDGTTKLPGGVLRPKNAQALRIPLEQGRNASATVQDLRTKHGKYDEDTGKFKNAQFIFLKSVKIPARPFNRWNDQDQKEINDALKAKLTQVLNRGK